MTEDEALEAIREVGCNYEMPSRAALEITHEYFAAERVLGEVVHKIGLM